MTAIGLYTNGRYTGNAEPIRQGQTISSQFLQWDGSAPFFRLGFFSDWMPRRQCEKRQAFSKVFIENGTKPRRRLNSVNFR